VTYNPVTAAIAAKVKILAASCMYAHSLIAQDRYPERLAHEAKYRLCRELAEGFMKEVPMQEENEPDGKVYRARVVPLSYERLLELLEEAYNKGATRYQPVEFSPR